MTYQETTLKRNVHGRHRNNMPRNRTGTSNKYKVGMRFDTSHLRILIRVPLQMWGGHLRRHEHNMQTRQPNKQPEEAEVRQGRQPDKPPAKLRNYNSY